MERVIRLAPKIVIGVVLTIMVVGFITWRKIPQIISSEMAQRTNVAVRLDTLRATPWTLTIKGFEIGNPKGFHLKKAFSMKKATVYAPLINYLKTRVIIPELVLNDIYLGLEFNNPTDRNGNWTVIINNVNQSVNKDIQDDPIPNPKSTFIKRVEANNINVEIAYKNKPGVIKKIPTVEQVILNNIDTKEGAPIRQIMSSVLGELIKSVVAKEHLKNMVEDTLKLKSGPVRSALKGLFGGTAPVELPTPTLEFPESPSPED